MFIAIIFVICNHINTKHPIEKDLSDYTVPDYRFTTTLRF